MVEEDTDISGVEDLFDAALSESNDEPVAKAPKIEDETGEEAPPETEIPHIAEKAPIEAETIETKSDVPDETGVETETPTPPADTPPDGEALPEIAKEMPEEDALPETTPEKSLLDAVSELDSEDDLPEATSEMVEEDTDISGVEDLFDAALSESNDEPVAKAPKVENETGKESLPETEMPHIAEKTSIEAEKVELKPESQAASLEETLQEEKKRGTFDGTYVEDLIAARQEEVDKEEPNSTRNIKLSVKEMEDLSGIIASSEEDEIEEISEQKIGPATAPKEKFSMSVGEIEQKEPISGGSDGILLEKAFFENIAGNIFREYAKEQFFKIAEKAFRQYFQEHYEEEFLHKVEHFLRTELSDMAEERLNRYVRKIVPDLAEDIIKDKLERILRMVDEEE